MHQSLNSHFINDLVLLRVSVRQNSFHVGDSSSFRRIYLLFLLRLLLRLSLHFFVFHLYPRCYTFLLKNISNRKVIVLRAAHDVRSEATHVLMEWQWKQRICYLGSLINAEGKEWKKKASPSVSLICRLWNIQNETIPLNFASFKQLGNWWRDFMVPNITLFTNFQSVLTDQSNHFHLSFILINLGQLKKHGNQFYTHTHSPKVKKN